MRTAIVWALLAASFAGFATAYYIAAPSPSVAHELVWHGIWCQCIRCKLAREPKPQPAPAPKPAPSKG